MTGMQPTPALGIRADGSIGKAISLERAVSGCGVEFIEVVDPYDLKELDACLKKAHKYVGEPEGGIAVIIARHPCLIRYAELHMENPVKVEITEECNACMYCIDYFECPALFYDAQKDRVDIDRRLCVDCGVCINACARGSIVPVEKKDV